MLGAGLALWSMFSAAASGYVEAEKTESRETVLATGKVTGKHVIRLSFTGSGVISELMVDEGEAVEQGQILAVLDNENEKNRIVQRQNDLEIAATQLKKTQTTDYKQALEELKQAQNREKDARLEYEQSRERIEVRPEEELKQARLALDSAQKQYQRQLQLYQEGIISSSELEEVEKKLQLAESNLALAESDYQGRHLELEQAQSSLEVAQSNVAVAQGLVDDLRGDSLDLAELEKLQAQARLEEAELAYEQTYLKSPLDGSITRVAASPGEFLQSGQEVLTLIPEAEVTYVEVQVEEDLTGRIVPGQEAVVTTTAYPDQHFSASVSHVSPGIDAARGTFNVRLELDQLIPELVPDLAVFAEIIIDFREESMILEQRYVYGTDGERFVYAYRGGRVDTRELEVESLGNGYLVVREGLEPGELILTNPDLTQGQRVRLAAEEK